ncbi:uncharacterized protein [Amphiura filiformis]|uniref:uncharacterized protein n=1 Tax=Amphiura filiformis TaxID=82378 RepID=UPI003B220831
MEFQCRLCGCEKPEGAVKFSKLQKPYCAWITKAFNITCGDDHPSLPDYVCDSCRRQLSRWNKATSSNKKVNLNIELYNFPVPQEAESSPVSLHAELFRAADEIAKQNNFQKWEQLSGDVCYVVFDMSTVTVDRCVTILSNGKWKIVVRGIEQNPTLLKTLNSVPDVITVNHLATIFAAATGKLCSGNPDFVRLMDRDERFGKDGSIQSFVEKGIYNFRGKQYLSTIRKKTCTYLANGDGQCPRCHAYRTDLNAMETYAKSKQNSDESRTTASSHVNHSNMNSDELKEKLVNVHNENRSLRRRNETLQKQMSHLVKAESVDLTGKDATEIQHIVNQHSQELDELLPQDSPQRLLWESQKAAIQLASTTSTRNMRWHPAIIRWCIALHSKSPAAYKAIRDSRFIILPHQNTLSDYIHYTNLQAGFHGDYILRLATDFNIMERADHEKHVSIAFDEIKIKSGLAYCAHSGKIVGFTEIGTLNEEFKTFERRCKGETTPPLATHMLVLMVRGITSGLQKPLSFFPCQHGFVSYELYNTLNEAVEILEFIGFQVHSFVSDGASANRKFYSMQQVTSDDSSTIQGTTFATNHIIRREDRIFFFCDVPHLIKTTRNCWENSGGNQKTRNMMYKSLPIRWTHLQDVYKWDLHIGGINPGLRMLHKIHHEHLHLSPSLRMRVYMAAQVLSGTVANAMEEMKKPEFQSTIKFIRMFNRFFDYLNVSAFDSTREEKKPYRTPDDPRLQWLTDNFLNFLYEWQHESDGMDFLTKEEKKRLCLSPQTLEGLRITVYSFVALTRKLLQLPGVHPILSEKFTQDPLEQYFSRQRASGGGNDNPTVAEFTNNTLSLQVSSDASKIIHKSQRGTNTRSKRNISDVDLLNSAELPKKRRYRSTEF